MTSYEEQKIYHHFCKIYKEELKDYTQTNIDRSWKKHIKEKLIDPTDYNKYIEMCNSRYEYLKINQNNISL